MKLIQHQYGKSHAHSFSEASPARPFTNVVMPNKHCLLINLAPSGLENSNDPFVPTDEPHGLIEGTVPDNATVPNRWLIG